MQIIIDKAKASIKNSDFVTTGCRNYIQVDFTFSEDWNDLIKTAVFYFDCKEDNKITAIIENDKCFLPTMGDVKIINIGVYGETAGENEIRISTNFVKVEVKQGAYDENAHPQYDDFYSYIQSNNIKYIRKNSGNIEYSTDGQEWFVCGGESNPFFYKTKIKPYLYTTIYETFDFDYAKQYIDSHYHNYNGACSTVSNGNFVGRNLDWYYDEEATFVIRASRSQSRYASIGTASGIKELTDNFANSNENSDLYKVLPYFMQDGINEKSVYCNINVVPAGDKGLTSGTTPLISQRLSISGVMLVRYILDNFATAKSAVEYIRDYVSVYGLKTISGVTQEFHFLVRDLTNTYILEFVNNALVILSSTDSDFTPIPNGKDIMTNFYLTGWNGQVKSVVMGNTRAEVQATGLTDHAMGLERYNIASSAYSTLSTKEDMVDLMTNQLKYSKTYQSATSPFWHSEYNAQYQTFGNVTIYSQLSDYQGVEEYSINKFQHRSRDEGSQYYGTWHTAHTSVYDIVDKKLYLYVQEEIGEYEGNIVIDLTQETRVSVSATGTATDEVRYITVDGVEKKLAGGGSTFVEVTYGTTTYTEVQTILSNGNVPYVSRGDKLYVYMGVLSGNAYFVANGGLTQYRLRLNTATDEWGSSDVGVQYTNDRVNTITGTETDAKYPSVPAVVNFVNSRTINLTQAEFDALTEYADNTNYQII